MLDGLPPATPSTIDAAFDAFHAANPWVYERLVAMTRELVAVGHTKVGMAQLFEVLRWQHARRTSDPASAFRLNHNYRSRYSRLIMRECPDLDGVFETRALADERR
jgi:hypothetical protein